MAQVHQVERKVPCTVVEAKIENKSYQYVVESDSSLDHCIEALNEIKDHLIKLKKEMEEKEKLESKNQAQG